MSVREGKLPWSVECDERVEVALDPPLGGPTSLTILGQLIGSEWLYSEPATVATIGHESGVIGAHLSTGSMSAQGPLWVPNEWCNVPF
jgi:hypothetical protein